MNYVTGDRRPIYVSNKQLQKPRKKDDKLIAELEFFRKNNVYDKENGIIHLPPMKEVEEQLFNNNYDIVKYNTSKDEDIKHLCSSFSCGNLIIDNFIKSNESLDSSISITYLFVKKDENNKISDLIGFFSLCTDSMLEKTDDYKIGKIFNGSAIRIHMFAIDKKFQQVKIETSNGIHTLATIMLLNCLNIITNIVNNHVGASYIVLNSTKEGQNLYKHTGNFEIIDDDFATPLHEDETECISMFKPIFEMY